MVAWIVLGATAFFLFSSQQILNDRRAAVRSFELQARQTSEALGNLRAAQQAYVADGQGPDFWAPKVTTLLESTAAAAEHLRTSAASAAARGVLIEASSNIAQFANVDRQSREYLASGQDLMASDVIFATGSETARAASRQIEASLLAEHQTFDLEEDAIRRQQAYAVGGAAAVTLLIVGLLGLGAPAAARTGAESQGAAGQTPAVDDTTVARDLSLRPGPTEPSHVAESPRVPVAELKAAAELCTGFGTARDISDLQSLLGQAATLIDASGLIVWLGSATGADLRPVLAHGYTDETLDRMKAIPQSADNATAQAYRSGRLQIVLARPGVSPGAVVVPLLSPDGTIGALTAEITGGAEASDSVQALAAILAAQLATVLAPSAEAVETHDQSHDQSASA